MSDKGTFILLTTGEFQDEVFCLGRDMERSVTKQRIFFIFSKSIKLNIFSFDAVTHVNTSKPCEDVLRYAKRCLPEFKLYSPSNKFDSSTSELERYNNPKDIIKTNLYIFSIYAMCLAYRYPGIVEYLNQYEDLGLSTRLTEDLFEIQEDGAMAPSIPAIDWVEGYFLQPKGDTTEEAAGDAAEAEDGSNNMSADKTALLVSVMESADNVDEMKSKMEEMKLQMSALKLAYETKIKDLEEKLGQETKPAVKWQKKAVNAKRPSANDTIELGSTPEGSDESGVREFEDSTYSNGLGEDNLEVSGVQPIDESLLDQEDKDSNDSGHSSTKSGNIIDAEDDDEVNAEDYDMVIDNDTNMS